MQDTSKFNEVAELLKVIGHPIRLTIIAGLMEQKSCVKDIWDCLGLPQATVSQHLSILKSKNILAVEKIGVRRRYAVNNRTVEELMKVLLEAAGGQVR